MSESSDEPLRTTAMAVGGAAVAHDAGGKVVFVDGALAGEIVRAEILVSKKRFARARLTEVLEPAPERRVAPCVHRRAGCGGCSWQEADPAAQLRWKRAAVVDSLTRLGGVADPQVHQGPALADTGFRTTLRCVVTEGRAGFRRARSHEPLPVDSCLVAHPLLEELLEEGSFRGCREVTLRAGARTGERLVLASPTAAEVRVPSDVTVVGEDELRRGRHAWFHEEAAGRRWRVSATSFFQARPDGADVLVDLVAEAIAEHLADLDGGDDARDGDGAATLVDLCCGVGLFAGAIGERLADGRLGTTGHGDRPWRVLGVERHRAAVADAHQNLLDLGAGARVARTGLAEWTPSRAGIVVADPARAGLEAAGARAVAATGAALVVLVSCDPASLGRDAALLAARGYRFEATTLVDLFPHTPHVEAVTRFVRESP